MSAFFRSAAFRKFLVIGVYALVGAAAQAGLLPVAVAAFLREHTLELALTALGLGHVLPEAAAKK